MALRRLVLVNVRVSDTRGCASNAVAVPVEQLLPAAVGFGRMLVSISPDAFVDPIESLPADNESVTKGVPSARQNASVSSASTLLHAGQRFILDSGGSTPLFINRTIEGNLS